MECQYLDALVLRRLARHGEAAERFRQALVASPDYLPARVGLAEALLESGALEESQRLFEGLIAEPRAEPAAELGLGRLDALKGRNDLAIAHFQRAIALFPEFGAAYYALGAVVRALRDGRGRAARARAA